MTSSRPAAIYARESLERRASVRPSETGTEDGVHFVDRFTFDPPGSGEALPMASSRAPSLDAAIRAVDEWIGTCRHCGHALTWSPPDAENEPR